MKYRNSVCLFILFFVFILTSCKQANTSTIVEEGLPSPTTVPTPSAGKAIMSGKAIDLSGNAIAETPVRLATIHRQGDQGAFIVDAATSPGAITDSEGNFTFIDVPPAEYLIVIGWLERSDYAIYQNNNGEPNTYVLEADQKLDVGNVQVNLTR